MDAGALSGAGAGSQGAGTTDQLTILKEAGGEVTERGTAEVGANPPSATTSC